MISSSKLKVVIVDFWSFNIILVALQKRCGISKSFPTSLIEPLQKRRISYTNIIWVMVRFVAILIPSRIPLLFSSRIAMLSLFATNKNKSGERGHPFLRPLSDRKKGEADPLMRTAKDAVEMHEHIHFIKE